MNGSKTCIAMVVVAALAGTAAADAVWSGDTTVDDDWFTGGNWTGGTGTGGIPSSADVVAIDDGCSAANPVVIDSASAAAAGGMRLAYSGSGDNGYLTIKSDLDVTGDLTVGRKGGEAFVTHESGDVTVSGGGGLSTLGKPKSRYDISGGSLDVDGDWLVGRGDSGTDAQFNQTGGTVTLHALIMGSGGYTGGSQQYNLSAGALVVEGVERDIGWKSEGNEFNHSGGTATFQADFRASTDTNDPGELTVTYSDAAQFTAQANYNVGSSGGGGEAWIVLDGSRTGAGTDVIAQQNVNFNALSHIEPIIDAAAIATASDMRKFDITGAISFDPGALIKPQFDAGATPTAGTWIVATYASATGGGDLAKDPATAAGWSFNVGATELTVSWVPEPATLAVLGLGGAVVLVRRRRR